MIKFISCFSLLLLFGCNYVWKRQGEPLAPGIVVKIVEINSTRKTNDGTPFHVVLKATDFSGFLVDDYQRVADEIAVSYPDSPEFLARCIVPGKKQRLMIQTHRDKPVAIYCLFTDPEEAWNTLIEPEDGFENVSIELGEHQIKSIKQW